MTSNAADGAATGQYVESLRPAAWMWATTLVLLISLAIALAVPLNLWVGLAVLAVGGAVALTGLNAATGRIRVVDNSLQVGPARLPLSDAGQVTVLDAEAARRLRGPDADARAYLYLRGWVPTAVRVDVADPSDPTPYWYVSSRHPDALAAALDQARG